MYTGKSAQCCVAAWMGGGFVGEWMHVYVWLSPFAIHLQLSQRLMLTPIHLSDYFSSLFASLW